MLRMYTPARPSMVVFTWRSPAPRPGGLSRSRTRVAHSRLLVPSACRIHALLQGTPMRCSCLWNARWRDLALRQIPSTGGCSCCCAVPRHAQLAPACRLATSRACRSARMHPRAQGPTATWRPQMVRCQAHAAASPHRGCSLGSRACPKCGAGQGIPAGEGRTKGGLLLCPLSPLRAAPLDSTGLHDKVPRVGRCMQPGALPTPAPVSSCNNARLHCCRSCGWQ